MDLDLPDASSLRKIITCTVEGILDEEDLLALAAPAKAAGLPAAKEVEDPGNLKRIREKHHSVARLIASGMTQRLVAMTAGYTESYLSILLNNPAMQELVELYRVQNGAAAQLIGERLRSVGLKAVEKLEERLDAEGEDKMDDFALIAVGKLGLDRGGHGPASKQHVTHESHVFDHAEIARLNQEALRGSSGYIVPISEVRRVLPSKAADDAE